jgi:hypothetical protein
MRMERRIRRADGIRRHDLVRAKTRHGAMVIKITAGGKA